MSFLDSKENVYRSRPTDGSGAENTWDRMIASGIVLDAALVKCISDGPPKVNCDKCIALHGLSNTCPICGALAHHGCAFIECSCGATLVSCISGASLSDQVISGVACRVDHTKDDTV